MNKEEAQRVREEISQLQRQVTNLLEMTNKDKFSNKTIHNEKFEANANVYIKDIDDISLTSIGDTSSGNESSNITANFNKIINALNNK